jgi:hypothetical protein
MSSVRFRALLPSAILCLAIGAVRPGQAQSSQITPPLDRNLLIADRGNNRIIEVTPDKQIIWEYDFVGLLPEHGADDAFFVPGNRWIVANLEYDNKIVLIDYTTRQIIWEYGDGTRGAGPNQLHTPDDAYMLSDGNISVADLDNCRVVIISLAKQIVRQYGHTHDCYPVAGNFAKPNGATPLPDGHILITEINNQTVTEIDADGRIIYRFRAPVNYPSDAQRTARGTIILADYSKYGSILELNTSGNILWQFGPDGDASPNHLRWPSLAAEMPNGNIVANDDYNHRVIVIDKQTRQIVWQYGVTGRRGDKPGYLNIPDGLDWRHTPDGPPPIPTF